MITIQKLMKAVIQRRKVPNLDLDLKVFKMKICGILEKLNKNNLSRYHFVAYFKQTSMCCYYMSQNLSKMNIRHLFFFNKFKKIPKKAQPCALKTFSNPQPQVSLRLFEN